MSDQQRRLGGVLGIGLACGVLFTAILAAITTSVGIFDPDSIDPGEEWDNLIGLEAAIGLVSGVAFGIILSVAERGTAVLALSLGRVALWAVLGAAVFPLLSGRYDQVLVMCPIGTIAALPLVALARRAARRAAWQPRRVRDAVGSFALACVSAAVEAPEQASA